MENLYNRSTNVYKFRKRKSVLDNFFYKLRKLYKSTNTAYKGFVFSQKKIHF